MYGKPFNHRQDFSEVHGIANYAFRQGEQRYNSQKEPVDEHGNLMPLPPVAKAEPKPAAAPPTLELDEDDTPADEKPFDLEAWAMGHPDLVGTPWQTVRSAAAEALGDITHLKSKDALKAALREHFHIT